MVHEVHGHRKATKAKLTFLGRNRNYIATSGSDKSNTRELAVWDLRNMNHRVMNADKIG
jgi:hypothetical protein